MPTSKLESNFITEEILAPGTDRTMTILELLSDHHDGLSAAEIGRLTDIPQNSVFRIMQTLQSRGYVTRREDDKRFTLTSRLFELTHPRVGAKSLAIESYDSLCYLRDQTGETAQLLVRAAWKAVVLEQVAGHHAVKVLGEVAMRVPLYSCAPGKAILAWLPDDELNRFFDEVKMKQYTPTTRATRKLLLADLIESRQRGYTIDRSEGLESIQCAAAPILNSRGYPIAGITIVGPRFRVTEDRFEEIGQACVEAAQQVQRRMNA
jgi:DNA-binding IclR family transcriptional regulator